MKGFTLLFSDWKSAKFRYMRISLRKVRVLGVNHIVLIIVPGFAEPPVWISNLRLASAFLCCLWTEKRPKTYQTMSRHYQIKY
jgi:hypothetical protein